MYDTFEELILNPVAMWLSGNMVLNILFIFTHTLLEKPLEMHLRQVMAFVADWCFLPKNAIKLLYKIIYLKKGTEATCNISNLSKSYVLTLMLHIIALYLLHPQEIYFS